MYVLSNKGHTINKKLAPCCKLFSKSHVDLLCSYVTVYSGLFLCHSANNTSSVLSMFFFFNSCFSHCSSTPASFRLSRTSSPSMINVIGRETDFEGTCKSLLVGLSKSDFGSTLTIPFVSKIAYSTSWIEKLPACLKRLCSWLMSILFFFNTLY